MHGNNSPEYFNSKSDRIYNDFQQGHIPVEWVNADSDSRNYHPAEQSIKLMTMHSSKGLEFPEVLIPGIGFMPDQYGHGTPEEEARLLDVAMKNIISIVWNNWLKPHKESILLFDSIAAASDIAMMLNGQWDGCNGVIIAKCDEVAVNTAAKLLETTWCYQGASKAVLGRVTTDEILRRYAMGERNFVNANLRCAVLASAKLSEINLSYAQLSWADLSQANLSYADLTAADLSKAHLMRTNLSGADLQQASLQRANLSSANLSEVNLTGADLTLANLALADLRGANFSECNLSGANLTGALFLESDLAFAKQ